MMLITVMASMKNVTGDRRDTIDDNWSTRAKHPKNNLWGLQRHLCCLHQIDLVLNWAIGSRSTHQCMHDGLWNGLFELGADVGDVSADMDGNLAQMLVSWCALVQIVIHLYVPVT